VQQVIDLYDKLGVKAQWPAFEQKLLDEHDKLTAALPTPSLKIVFDTTLAALKGRKK